METNLPRNSWPQTHQDDGTGGGAEHSSASGMKATIDRIDSLSCACRAQGMMKMGSSRDMLALVWCEQRL